MRAWWILLLVLLPVPVFAADWQDLLTPLKPGVISPPRPLTAVYRFGWGVVPAAEAQMSFARDEKGQLQVQLNMKTIGAVRALWQMDAQHTALCSPATFLPISFQQTVKYRRETETTRADFTANDVVRLLEVEPPDFQEPKPKRFEFPNLCDIHSALMLVRSQPLKAGEKYSLVVYPDRAAFLARVTVAGREAVKVAGRNYHAIKMQVALERVDKKCKLVPNTRCKNAFVWLSDDHDRLLLKIQSEVFVGHVWTELQSVKFADDTRDPRQISESRYPGKSAWSAAVLE